MFETYGFFQIFQNRRRLRGSLLESRKGRAKCHQGMSGGNILSLFLKKDTLHSRNESCHMHSASITCERNAPRLEGAESKSEKAHAKTRGCTLLLSLQGFISDIM